MMEENKKNGLADDQNNKLLNSQFIGGIE